MTPRSSRRRDACAERRGRRAGCSAAGMPAMGEGLAVGLMLRTLSLSKGRKHEAHGPGEPGTGVPLLLNEKPDHGAGRRLNTWKPTHGRMSTAFHRRRPTGADRHRDVCMTDRDRLHQRAPRHEQRRGNRTVLFQPVGLPTARKVWRQPEPDFPGQRQRGCGQERRTSHNRRRLCDRYCGVAFSGPGGA